MVVLSKKLGQFRQWTGERLGVAEKTQASEDFRRLDLETESRKDGIEKLAIALEDYAKTLDKRSSQDKKISAIAMLTKALIQQGHFHGDSAPIGMTLLKIGEAEDKVKGLQEEFAETVRKGLLLDMMALHASMKDYDALKKKLENRRLDYDAKLNKFNKSKKEKPGLEEEMKTAQKKYNETLADLESLMSTFAEREELLLAPLVEFAEAQCCYYEKSLAGLKELCVALKQSPPGDRHFERQKSQGSSRSSLAPSQERTRLPTVLPPAMVESKKVSSGCDNAIEDPPELAAHQPPEPISNLSRRQSIKRTTIPQQAPPPPQGALRRSSSLQSRPHDQVVAQYDFTAENDSELSISKGDVIQVLEKIDDGWWLGRCGSRQGIFPANYAESVAAPAAPADRRQDRGNGLTLPKAGAGIQTACCSACSCSDFSPNIFKPKKCNNCFHEH